jgi:PAS domain S-box-containing protein
MELEKSGRREIPIPQMLQLEMTRKDGTTVWTEVRLSFVRDENQRPVGILGVARDITERKRVEDEQRESEKKYRELYDFLPIPVYEMDLEANITSANRAIYETFRGTEEVLKRGFKAWQLISPEDIDKSRNNIERLLKGEPVEDTEYTLMRLDGSVFPAIVISSVIYSNDKPVGLRGAIVDITERKQAEKKLRESEERYKALFDRSLDLVYIHDFEGRFIDANAAALNRLDYRREEILSLNFASLLSEDQFPLAFKTLQEIKETGIQKNLVEFRLRHKDGSDVYVETQGSIIMSNGKPVAIQAIARDITERKRAEEELHRTVESLRKAVGATIQVLASAVETRDPYTAGHQQRSADLARAIATEMGLPQEKIDEIRIASSIHDIGKLSIPAEILSKPTKLTNLEFSMIKEHAQKGYEMLKDVESPWPLAEIAHQHHERMDGSGYPQGLKGKDILLEARILAVADVVEAMASHRPYRPGLGMDAALDEIAKNRDTLYDPEVVDACLRLFKEKGFKLK